MLPEKIKIRDTLDVDIIHLHYSLLKRNERVNRGKSAHVLLNLLNELKERDKMRGLLIILTLFRNDKNTGAKNVRFYLKYGKKIILKSHFWRKNVRILPYA